MQMKQTADSFMQILSRTKGKNIFRKTKTKQTKKSQNMNKISDNWRTIVLGMVIKLRPKKKTTRTSVRATFSSIYRWKDKSSWISFIILQKKEKRGNRYKNSRMLVTIKTGDGYMEVCYISLTPVQFEKFVN